MAKIVWLDAGPLAMVSHPRKHQEIKEWLRRLLEVGTFVFVPEIADYEVRRELLRAHKPQSIERLDALKSVLGYVPLTTRAMLKAAQFWAEVRRQGRPTADASALDGDVILAAQAVTMLRGNDDGVVVTNNVGHISRFVQAKRWDEIS